MNEELKVIITAEIENLKKELDNAQKQTKDFSDKGSKHFEAFSKAAAGVGKATKEAMKIAGAALAAGAAAMVGIAEATEEYRANQAKLTTAFESAGAGAEEAAKTYNDLYRVLGDDGQATEAAAHLAQLTSDEKELAEWTQACQGIYATFGDSLPIEGLTEAANETAKVGQVTGSLADALNWAGISEDEFNAKLEACNSEAEREQLIRETLTSTYGEAAAAYEKNAEEILKANEAQAKLNAGLGAIGEAVTPIITIFKDLGGTILSDLAPSFGILSEGLTDMVNGVEGGADKVKEGIQGIVDNLLTTLTDMLPTVLQIGVDIIVALVTGIAEAIPDLVTGIMEVFPTILDTLTTAIPQITGAILGALPAILEALIQIVSEIIIALGEMLPTIIEQIVAILPVLIETLISNIPVLLEAAIQLLMAIVDAIPLIIPPLIEALPSIYNSLITALLEALPLLIDGAVQLLMGIIDAIPLIIPALIEAIPQIINTLIDAIIGAIPILLEGAFKLLMAIVLAIPKIIPPLIAALPQIVTTVITNLADKLGGVFSDIWNGIVSIFGKVKDWFKQKFKDAAQAIYDVIKPVVNFFTDTWNKIKGIFSKVGEVVGNAITNTVKKAINGVLSTAVKIINGFIGAINFAIGIINAIPGVSISKLKTLSVPQLAKGGVIDSATLAVVGERGKEAVVPLENNLEWLDKLATMLTDRIGGGSQPIYLMVDKRVLGQVSAEGINDITRQTGNMPLVVM